MVSPGIRSTETVCMTDPDIVYFIVLSRHGGFSEQPGGSSVVARIRF